MLKRAIAYIVLIAIIIGCWGITGCSREKTIPKQQLTILNQLLSTSVSDKQVETIEIQDETARKFPAIDKMFKVVADEEQENYVFLVSPIGYRAPINIMVAIDGEKDEIAGIKVLQQDETPGWGEWLAETWFTDRFKGKGVDIYLERAVLEAKAPNEIIQITSATVTTQAVLNGVNAAMGAYRELVLGSEAEAVPLNVEGFITESE
ncbi:FMN-binding protein [Syntrophomonas wolfei]|uniref:FMN-binding protein n=1 Tax=Syntrophomonas wolfei TaxID=863 RepID=UPI0023F45145|nr:FMN-binding protein [Syntrophomonas wolfei]